MDEVEFMSNVRYEECVDEGSRWERKYCMCVAFTCLWIALVLLLLRVVTSS